MTAALNKVQLIGNLGGDPKSITGKDGQSFITVTLATNESFKQNEEWKSRVEWHQLLMFGKLTKVADYLKKGSQVYIEGILRSNHWTDSDDNNRQSLSIVVNNIQLLSQPKSADETSNKNAERHVAEMREMLQEPSEDVPF